MGDSLEYQTVLVVGAATFSCIESYETVHSRIRDASFKFDDDEQGMRFLAPIELTVGCRFESDDEARLVRAAFAPAAISTYYEIPADVRNEAP